MSAPDQMFKLMGSILRIFLLLLFFLYSGCKDDKPCTACPPSTPPADDTTANPRKLISNGGYPDWSPTNERLAFVRDSSIFLYYFSDKHIDSVTIGTEPNFSHDGTKLTFERDKKIYWMDLTTKQETYLADGITPNWSANGKWIAFANKNASRFLTDGTIIYGQPSPDSSLYYYDLDENSVKRIVITNYDSLWTGNLSLFFPTWAMHDSILFFSSEFGIWKVHNTGGVGVYFIKDFSSNANLYKRTSIEDLGNSGQQRWNEATRRLAYFQLDESGDHVYIPRVHVLNFNTGFEDGGIGVATDPCLSPDGTRFAYFAGSSIFVYKL
ncbi:MAG TPA: hypothetical protein VMM58_04065 [Bacteroidota bacterium]|nr:hypothetical protein [Bacteroidota bacterium]